tara:strand:- start:935 stop:1333 length:399 start_codon:yes stop_codon:yes gene_type:complete
MEPTTTPARFQNAYMRMRSSFLCKIESSEGLTGTNYRWSYTVQPGYLTGDLEDPVFNDRGETLAAMNARELNNTATDVQGVDPNDLPDGFDFGAVSGYVMAWPGARLPLASGEDLGPIAVFEAPNPVEGACA